MSKKFISDLIFYGLLSLVVFSFCFFIITINFVDYDESYCLDVYKNNDGYILNRCEIYKEKFENLKESE